MATKLMVRSLAFHVREDQIRVLFERYGTLTECKVIMDRNDPSKSRGFAFISFTSPDDARTAVEKLDNYNLEGRNIRVHFDEKSDNTGGGSGGRPRFDDQRRNSQMHDDGRRNDNNDRSGRYGNDDRRDDRDRYSRDDRRGDRSSRDDRDRRDGRDRYSRDDRDRSPRRHVGSGAEDMQDPNNLNGRIYIEGLPDGTTEDEIAAHFGMLGQVARKRQRQGFPNEWPFKVSIYRDESGAAKGDATLTYVDPNAAQSAPGFFNNTEFKGVTIKVQMAEAKDEPSKPQQSGGGGPRRDGNRDSRGGGGGGGGRYDRNRDNRDYGRR